MKKLLLIIPIIILFGCGGSETENEKPNKRSYEYDGGLFGSYDFAIVEKTIDSCEYIIIIGIKTKNIIHKANCKNHQSYQ